MNVKKIIKGIIGLGAVSGIVYAAYKLGEQNGEANERFRQKYDEDDDEYDFDDEEELDNYNSSCFVPKFDEPDDGCIAPKENKKPKFTIGIYDFAPLDSIKVDGVSDEDMNMLVYHISFDKYTSNKQIREWLEVDKETAAKVISALKKAGYIGNEYSNYIIPVNITTEVYFRLRGDLD